MNSSVIHLKDNISNKVRIIISVAANLVISRHKSFVKLHMTVHKDTECRALLLGVIWPDRDSKFTQVITVEIVKYIEWIYSQGIWTLRVVLTGDVIRRWRDIQRWLDAICADRMEMTRRFVIYYLWLFWFQLFIMNVPDSFVVDR